jgi:hypothetical protein
MAERPAGTYVQNVLNPFGLADNLPSGFVNVVYSRNGEVVGYMSDGQFVELGAPAPAPQETQYGQLSPEEQLALSNSRANVAKANMNVAKVGSDQYNKAKQAYDQATKEVTRLKTIVAENKKRKKDSVTVEKGKTKLETLKKKLQRAKDAGQDTSAIEQEITKIKGDVAQAESNLKTPAKAATKTGEVKQTPETARQGDVMAAPARTVTTGNAPDAGTTRPSGPSATKKPTKKTKTKEQLKTEAGNILSGEFQIIDAVAQQDPELRQALIDYSNGKITKDELRRRTQNSRFVATNSQTIRQRLTDKAVYDQLSPEERASGTSAYEQSVGDIFSIIKDKATKEGAAISDEDARKIAERLYITGQDSNTGVVAAALRPYIKVGMTPEGVATVGGAAGSNYRELLSAADQNGIKFNQLPAVLGYKTLDDALQQLAAGESVDTLKQRIRSYASTGQSDFVKNQLAQGVDLRTIAQPYITAMATVLEINPEQIDLSDKTLQAGLQNNGMNIFDYQKALRKDSRWQYTRNADTEVANKTMRLLRDFGLEA